MSEEPKPPKPRPSKQAKGTSESRHGRKAGAGEAKAQARARANQSNPIVDDATYGGLREENRVVMRHQIALNLDTFRAAPDDFAARPTREYPALKPAATPFFSVIVPNYNGLVHLPVLFAALAGQRFPDFEVIVVDDASTDGSVEWLGSHYPDVRVLVNRRNLGFVASCNSAADAARGRVLVFLNNDTEPDPGWTEALAQAVCAHPHAAIFASKLMLFDKRSVIHSAGDSIGLDGIPRNRGVWEEDMGQYDAAGGVFGGCGGAVAYRREAWTALSGFDDSFWMYLEDADFAFRAQLAGWDAVFVPLAKVYHRLSATGGGALASYYVGRNTIWLVVKNMPRSLLVRNLPRIAAAQVRIAWDAVRNWRGEAARARLRGQVAGLLGLAGALRQRRVIQARRVRDDRELAARMVG